MCNSNHQIVHSHGGRYLILWSKSGTQAAVVHLLRGDMVGWKEGWLLSLGCQLDLSGIVLTSGQSTTHVHSLLMMYFWVWRWTGRTLPTSQVAQVSLLQRESEFKEKKIYTLPYHSLKQRREVSYEFKGMICKEENCFISFQLITCIYYTYENSLLLI